MIVVKSYEWGCGGRYAEKEESGLTTNTPLWGVHDEDIRRKSIE